MGERKELRESPSSAGIQTGNFRPVARPSPTNGGGRLRRAFSVSTIAGDKSLLPLPWTIPGEKPLLPLLLERGEGRGEESIRCAPATRSRDNSPAPQSTHPSPRSSSP